MKKILALVLALTLALGTFSFAAAAPEDVVGTDCENAVARLGALGIIAGYPDGTYRPDQPVTRAEFAKIIVSALGVGEAAQYAAGATKFPDVAADHWATGYINVAVDVGVINGYPDGTFLPENQVTFAEAIKMIVAALGYTPKAEAMGGYPGGYLAVAAEEEITDGVNVVGTLAANRGAIAMMVDNSLEVDLMEQVSYGDKPTWEVKEDKSLLKTKLGVAEVEGVVEEISKVAKLADNKFVLDNGVTYELVIDVNTESLFLKEVTILHKDKKVVWVDIDTADADIVFDTVVIDSDDNDGAQVALKVADKTYAWIDDDIKDATIYVNYEENEATDAADLEGFYGYFIFDGKEIISANLFDFEEKGFVTAVDDDEIEYIDLFDAEEQVLDLDDYDEIYVYNSDFTAADLDDIDEDSVIFFWDNDDDELFVMVVNEVVAGEVTRLRDDRVTVDGTNYVRAKNGDVITAVVSLNEGEDFDAWDAASDYDIIDEEVNLYLDLNGQIAALVTAAEATSETQYGILTWFYSGRNASIAVFTSEGEEVEYYFEESVDVAAVEDYETDGNDNETVWAIKYKLNSDGEIAEGSLEVLKEDTDDEIAVSKLADRKYVEGDGNTYFISSSTVLMKALDDDELDPELVKYDTLVDMAFASDVGDALIFGDPDKNAKMIVFTNTNFTGSKDDVYFAVVTDNPWKVGTSWFTEMDVFGEGKADYKLSASDQFGEGELAAFYLDSSDKVKKETDTDVVVTITGYVYERDGSYITLGTSDPGVTYRVASGAVLYQLDEDDDLDGTIRLTRINAGDYIEFLYDVKEKEIVAAIVDQNDVN
jgi:hypothetical protein